MTDTDEAPPPPAGWYPRSDGTRRYWDGAVWLDVPEPPTDPPPPPTHPRTKAVTSQTAPPQPSFPVDPTDDELNDDGPAPRAPRWAVVSVAAVAVVIFLVVVGLLGRNYVRDQRIDRVEDAILQSSVSGEFRKAFPATNVVCDYRGDRDDGRGELECFATDAGGLGYYWNAVINWRSGEFAYKPS